MCLEFFLGNNKIEIGIEKDLDLIASKVETLPHYFVNCRDLTSAIGHVSSTMGL